MTSWTKASPRLGYEPALDGLRGVAIALVVSWHAFGWPARGFLGVHLFFVLSGFLITALLLQEWQRAGAVSLPSFYKRRALRLFPALAALLLTYVLVQTAREVLVPGALDLGTALKGALYGAFYVTNVVQAAGVVLPVPLNHLWSLAAEEQFYLLWPFALVAVLRLGARRGVVVGALVAGIALVAAQRLRLSFEDAEVTRIYYGPDTTFDAILIGCLLGIWFTSGAPRVLHSERLFRLALPAGLVATFPVLFVDASWKPLQWGVVLPFAVTCAAVIWAVMQRRARWLERALTLRPLVALGVISYSLYLWHPIVIWSGVRLAGVPPAVGVFLALAVAIVSYMLVERPFLRRKARERARIERPQVEAATARPQEGGFPAEPAVAKR